MATKKKEAEAESAEPKTVRTTVDVPACVNCGQQATHKETNPGAVAATFCATCGQRAYGGASGKLEPL